jgi:hypothetical protein
MDGKGVLHSSLALSHRRQANIMWVPMSKLCALEVILDYGNLQPSRPDEALPLGR